MLNRLLCSDTRASVRSSTTTSGNTSSSFHTEYLPSRDWSAVSRLRHHQTACNMADASWRARTITNSPVWSNSWRLSLISSPGLSTSVATQPTLYVAEFIRSEQLKETHQIHILIFCNLSNLLVIEQKHSEWFLRSYVSPFPEQHRISDRRTDLCCTLVLWLSLGKHCGWS